MKFIALGMMVFLAACSNKSIYTGMQEGNRQECNKMPEYQRQQCLDKNNQSYEDYKRERDALKSSAE
ncbi:hypothetical protein R50072_06960 [Simiduia litorea]|uniref:hypothetical protein n=1 Tax=Simiduia litorea TaxID=1435348 RepID=UPI0036F21B69